MSAYIGSLDSSYIKIINNLMTIERHSLEQMETKRDTINIQRAAYADSRTKLDALQDSLQALISTDAFYDFEMGRSASVSPADPDDAVVSASPGSSAVPGSYELSVTSLAKAERYTSAAQIGTDLPLGLTGDFWLGGTGTASAAVTSGSSVDSVSTSSVLENWSELGTGEYTVEVAEFDGVLKFRLKDADGNTVGIRNSSDTDSLTTSWQEVGAGETYDTGRGLTIDFGSSPASGSNTIDYTAAGTSVSIEASDTLADVASKINSADQPDGRGVLATIVDKQLILTAEDTGTNHTMIFSDGVGLGLSLDQSAQDASFTVNGVSMTRSSNSNLTNVINGVTLDLAADAEGNSAVIEILSNDDPPRQALEAFIENFNDVQSYIAEKTAVTRVSDDDEETSYKRGILASDFGFNELRSNLFSSVLTAQDNDGAFNNLREIGITISDSMTLSISDSNALTDALTTDFDSVAALLDSVMADMDTIVSRFTGSETSDGYLETALESFDDQLNDLNENISDENDYLYEREEYYIRQYSELQAQMTSMSYMQQQWSSIYGSTNRSY